MVARVSLFPDDIRARWVRFSPAGLRRRDTEEHERDAHHDVLEPGEGEADHDGEGSDRHRAEVQAEDTGDEEAEDTLVGEVITAGELLRGDVEDVAREGSRRALSLGASHELGSAGRGFHLTGARAERERGRGERAAAGRDRADLLLAERGVHPRASAGRRARPRAGRDPSLAPLPADPGDDPEAPERARRAHRRHANAFHRRLWVRTKRKRPSARDRTRVYPRRRNRRACEWRRPPAAWALSKQGRHHNSVRGHLQTG